MISYMELIKAELTGIYGEDVLRDINEVIRLYEVYEGKGQDWDTPPGLDYIPTKKKANYIKKLIKDEARFLFGKPPEFKVVCKDEEAATTLTAFINGVLHDNLFSDKLVKAARDCFIGKRVAVKVTGGTGRPLRIHFVPSLGFVYEPDEEHADSLKSIVFFHNLTNTADKDKQRIWKQRYRLVEGVCRLDEGIYNGFGETVEIRFTNYDTGLDFIPARVIVNDGLTGDLKGESDVEELLDAQYAYNRLASDDIDALRFNMFPQTVAVNADEDSLKKIKIAPAALVDLQTDAAVVDGQAQMYKLESSFNYNDRLENTLGRLKGEMHELLSVPNVSPEELKGFITSGKSMKALYWQLVTRCEEKYAAWRPALEWLGLALVKMARVYHTTDLPEAPNLSVTVENIYPLFDDELEEKASDMQAVNTQVMSRKAYITKWNISEKDKYPDNELKQMRFERELLEDSYAGDIAQGASPADGGGSK